MKCLILAAGYATRLYPLTENFPKPLLKVGEKAILDWLVDDLVDTTDIDEFVVISNHKFAQYFEAWKNKKIKMRPYEITVIDDGTSTNETRLGAVKDIQLAVEKLNLTDDLLVMAGDNVLNFSLSEFVDFAKEKGTSCVMCHEENELKKQQKTAIITLDGNNLITSYEEKPREPKGNLAVPPFYCYRACDVRRIQEALDNGCGYDAPGSFAAWLSKQTPMHAFLMPGKRYDIGEKFEPTQRVKVYVLEVKNTTKGPKVMVSRTHPELVKRLFESEVSEVAEGIVEIKSIAREAGSRTKMAVWSNDPNVDAVGACVGMNGSRVNAVVNELNGEKIDIITWDENPALLIENALSPAKVISVVADEDEKEAQVIVPDYQLSLAIGKEGQNARLAARLTTYKIDIKSETQARELGLFDDMDFGEEGFEGEYEKDVEPAGEEAPAENEAPAEETSEAQAETEE